MALRGTGILAIWNDIAPGGDAEFTDWHTREHVPERIAGPGFLRGRRYSAVSGSPKYFTLYETEAVETGCPDLLSPEALSAHGASGDAVLGTYRLLFCLVR
jgi:hypothetical protein